MDISDGPRPPALEGRTNSLSIVFCQGYRGSRSLLYVGIAELHVLPCIPHLRVFMSTLIAYLNSKGLVSPWFKGNSPRSRR